MDPDGTKRILSPEYSIFGYWSRAKSSFISWSVGRVPRISKQHYNINEPFNTDTESDVSQALYDNAKRILIDNDSLLLTVLI